MATSVVKLRCDLLSQVQFCPDLVFVMPPVTSLEEFRNFASPASAYTTPVGGVADEVARPRNFSRKIASMLAEFTPGMWMFLDFVLAAACVALTFILASWRGQLEPTALDRPTTMAVYGALFCFGAHVLGLHDRSIPRREVSLIIKSLLASLIAVALSYYGTKHLFQNRIPVRPLAMAGFLLFSLLLLSRAWIWRVGMLHAERLCLLGRRSAIVRARDFMLQQPRPVEIHLLDMEQAPTDSEALLRWAKSVYLDEFICVDEVSEPLAQKLLLGMEQGIRVTSYQDHLERHYACVSLDHLSTKWFLHTDMEALHPQYIAIKRCGDVILASLGLLIASPFLLLAALAIRFESKGPIFYSQIRTGLRGKPFPILKLRSMRTDAECNGAQWASKGDSRVTRVGKFLRLSRLDEVPQFINILRGDMAFIGPRPERPEFVEKLAAEIPFYKQRHLLKPGLTGWAQIQADYGGNIAGVKQKLQFDLFYVKYASFTLDLHICIRTLGAMMKGAR
jgi:exopolysaccharide biosynthesis polyprenyl glycosylphosphotransferase